MDLRFVIGLRFRRGSLSLRSSFSGSSFSILPFDGQIQQKVYRIFEQIFTQGWGDVELLNTLLAEVSFWQVF